MTLQNYRDAILEKISQLESISSALLALTWPFTSDISRLFSLLKTLLLLFDAVTGFSRLFPFRKLTVSFRSLQGIIFTFLNENQPLRSATIIITRYLGDFDEYYIAKKNILTILFIHVLFDLKFDLGVKRYNIHTPTRRYIWIQI